ncbi:uncharacterized protein YcbK (DUF882 family) [Roseibium hamelinense]|uniref:Murein endopeptidase K n=1 Tax=Roseibium hamelinense TaxID=150831 RepID=A0A562SMC6_9HYPH|nr:uncharacterized protein YcbK (DUF882 family) [Roseibium hamelinense]
MVLTLLCGILSVAISLAAHAQTRTLKLYNTHTKERVSVTFKKNGRYIPSGLREANRFLRDWRRNEITKIDPELLDLVWEVYQEVGARDYIYVVSSYRSPATNNMLRKRSSGVARKSQHTFGRAMDFYIPGVNLSKLRAAGLRKQVGGVGYYPRSGSPFVHMDTGRVRHWPKMSRSQLARVFPDGKTLHIPSDGKPLKGYKQALAEAKSGKSRSSSPTIVASSGSGNRTTGQSLRDAGDPIRPTAQQNNDSSGGGGNILASLFRSNNSSEERSRVAAVRPNGAPVPPGAIGSSRVAAAIENPPVPTFKSSVLPKEPEASPEPALAEQPTVVAAAAPGDKPAQQPTAPAPAPNTLDAQLVAIARGETTSSGTAPAPDGRLEQAVSVPGQKPSRQLLTASLKAAAAETLEGKAPVPRPAPATDAVAAIAAATNAQPRQKELPTSTTLAYASPTALPADLRAAPKPQVQSRSAKKTQSDTQAVAKPSVSGRIPASQIQDPLAGFVGFPDKSEPRLLSASETTRNRLFASLQHPDQRSLDGFMQPSNRFLTGGFERQPYGSLRTDRFEGPAIVVLPVTFAR